MVYLLTTLLMNNSGQHYFWLDNTFRTIMETKIKFESK